MVLGQNGTQATLVGGKSSHPSAISLLPSQINYNHYH